ncbi:MAG: hypothetical protein Q6373_007355 [Candidatus Sigynarchaeota archaeon]
MICPHGQPDESTCPECSMLHDVKPLARASGASFTSVEIRRASPTPAVVDSMSGVSGEGGRDIPTTTLRITRLSTEGRGSTMLPGNSANLHARLAQILGKGFEIGTLDDAIEQRIAQIRKQELNPRAKRD